MMKEIGMSRWVALLAAVGILTVAGCMSDKGANGDTPFEAPRYPAMRSYLDSAFAQFCASFDDALAARFEIDTDTIPDLEWPFKMPPRRRDGTPNSFDENTSWGVGYNRQIDTTRFDAFWDLGRFVDTGVLIYTSPIVASRIEHVIYYNRIDGFGDEENEWSGALNVSLSELDAETAQLAAGIEADHKVGGRCNKLACDKVEIVITNGEFGKVAGEFDLSTLSGVITGTITLTEFDVILGHDAVFIWEITGTITDGVANVTAGTRSPTGSSGKFSETDSYSLCP